MEISEKNQKDNKKEGLYFLALGYDVQNFFQKIYGRWR